MLIVLVLYEIIGVFVADYVLRNAISYAGWDDIFIMFFVSLMAWPIVLPILVGEFDWEIPDRYK